MDIDKINENLKKFKFGEQLESEQQMYIRKSRDLDTYKDLLKCANEYFKKELGITIKNLGFFTAPTKGDFTEGKMYQMAWYFPHYRYACIFIDAKSIKNDILVEFVKNNEQILFDSDGFEESLDRYIELDLVSIMFDVFELFKLISWDLWEGKQHMLNDEEVKMFEGRTVIDQDSNLFNEKVNIVGFVTYRSYKCENSMYIVKKFLSEDETYWMLASQLSAPTYK